MNKVDRYRTMTPAIRTFRSIFHQWRYNVGFLNDGTYDIVLTSTEKFKTEKEAQDMARFVICTSWDVEEISIDE